MARTRTHIIETLSRRIVTSLLPPELFLERDQTERDYGIDMSVECFDEGEPSGAYLLLQLKGTDDPVPDKDSKYVVFDMDVNHLRRTERFATPVLLVWCPVQSDHSKFWFVWLQSYIRVVLNYEKPDWRHQKFVRLHIPVKNVISKGDDLMFRHLRFIANHPARVEQFGQLTRLAKEATFHWDDPRKLGDIFRECLRLDAIFGDPNWGWGKFQRESVEKGLLACEIALRRGTPSDEDFHTLGQNYREPSDIPADESEELRRTVLAHTAQHHAYLLLNAVAIYFDDRLRHTVWEAEGTHDY